VSKLGLYLKFIYTTQPTEDNIIKIAVHEEGYTYSAESSPLRSVTCNTTLQKDKVSTPSFISTPRTVRTHGERGLDIPLEMAQLLRAELRMVYPELADLPFKSTRMCWCALYSPLIDHPPIKLAARSC
jgi:sarcosine oxidase/L-pipecolate oxidase